MILVTRPWRVFPELRNSLLRLFTITWLGELIRQSYPLGRNGMPNCGGIFSVFDANFRVYGVRKVWRQMQREGIYVARCTVGRLMRSMGLQGVIRGKPIKTTIQNKAVPCPLDHVNRQFHAPAPNRLWVSDFTYVATWAGFVYVAFVIDTDARRIVGWRASRTADAGFVLDAMAQAVHDRRPAKGAGLVHHSDRGSQYLSIKYTERLAEAGIEPPIGSVGDSYDNALADDQRPVQSRSYPPSRPLAQLRSRGIRNPRMGGLVQQPPPARAHRQHPPRRSRSKLLRSSGNTRLGRVTDTSGAFN